jgi:hypothetical protein
VIEVAMRPSPSKCRRPPRSAAALLAVALASLGLASCFDEQSWLPDIPAIQAAYDGAKLEEIDHHDDQLLIRQADCRRLDGGQFTCQVAFTDQRSSNGRLYFDVIGLDRIGRTWKLVSGLCRR